MPKRIKVRHFEEGVPGFDWDSLENNSGRIARNSAKYKDVSIAEAFAEEYKLKLPKHLKQMNDDCRELHIGDVVDLAVSSITKRGVNFDTSYKEEIVCNVDLYQYEKFRKMPAGTCLTCKVLSKTNDKVVVDPFAVFFDRWIDSKLCLGRRGNMEPSAQQYDMEKDRSSKMKGLHLIKSAANESVKGGYSGRLRVDTLSDFVGQDVYIDAFIPGSQIVLNIEPDFTRWEGKEVDVFVLNYLNKPSGRNSTMSVVCSAKEVKKFDGQKRMIQYFNDYTEDNKAWNELKSKDFNGIVTGVLHRSKICGVFVEIPELNVTGMIEVQPSELVNYKPQQEVKVCWDHFIEPTRFNKDIGQVQHLPPYVIEEGRYLKEFNIKPIFKWAE